MICFEGGGRLIGGGVGAGHEGSAGYWPSCLCKGQPSLIVHFEDLLNGVDVSGRPQVQTQVVLGGRAHDLLHNKVWEEGEENQSIPIQNQSVC